MQAGQPPARAHGSEGRAQADSHRAGRRRWHDRLLCQLHSQVNEDRAAMLKCPVDKRSTKRKLSAYVIWHDKRRIMQARQPPACAHSPEGRARANTSGTGRR